MVVDPREYVEKDKRLPVSLAGDKRKVIVVNEAEDAYVHSDSLVIESLTGEIILWPFDVPPGGFLICDGATYNYDDYPALGALFGAAPGGTFVVPDINFLKNSKGTDSNVNEAEDVGPHDHGADAVGDHGHGISVNSVGNHTHAVSGNAIAAGSSPEIWVAANQGVQSGGGGAHNHSASASGGGGHTPSIHTNTGVRNQPSCTRINFLIKT